MCWNFSCTPRGTRLQSTAQVSRHSTAQEAWVVHATCGCSCCCGSRGRERRRSHVSSLFLSVFLPGHSARNQFSHARASFHTHRPRIVFSLVGDDRAHTLARAVREMEDDVAGRELWNSAQKGCIAHLLPSHASAPTWMLRAFLVALANDHVDTVAQLVRAAPCLVNAQLVNAAGVETPLAHAAFYGCVGAIRLLLDLKAVVSPGTVRTPMYLAVCGGRVPAVELLATAGVDVNEGGYNAPLQVAARFGDVRMVQALHEMKADLESKDPYGRTPICAASHNGHSAVVQWLVRSNASVNCTSVYGETPMHAAARHGHAKVLKLLLDAKAGATVVDDEGITPLCCARFRRDERAVQLLLQSLP
jgi:ankyrin repeat protein